MIEKPHSKRTLAHALPLAVFMVCLAIPDLMTASGIPDEGGDLPWYLRDPAIWLYPVQTLLTLGILAKYRRHYELQFSRSILVGAAAGVIGILFWIAPGWLFAHAGWSHPLLSHLGFVTRESGFDPTPLSEHGIAAWWLVIGFRFLRLVLVVPLAEEIFWRGFLMRFLAAPDENYWQVPFGTHDWRAFWFVTIAFTLIHSPADYFAAFLYGSLTYLIAIRTRSLAACVTMHAVANLLLGMYVVISHEWGYW